MRIDFDRPTGGKTTRLIKEYMNDPKVILVLYDKRAVQMAHAVYGIDPDRLWTHAQFLTDSKLKAYQRMYFAIDDIDSLVVKLAYGHTVVAGTASDLRRR